MSILIRYSDSSHQDASDGIFNYSLSLWSKFSISGLRPWAIALLIFLKLANFLPHDFMIPFYKQQ